MKTFSIVIVNWNSGAQLKECIDSINTSVQINCILNKIIVVDNNSDDESLNLINNDLDNLTVLRNNKNFGFGKACNQGASNTQGDFILFLNPDTLIFKDTFLNLFNYIKINERADIGIYGVQLVDKDFDVQRNCARFPSLSTFMIRSVGLNKLNPNLFKSYTMENWDHLSTREVDQVMGAFFMIKRDLFIRLNGFDERFFIYYEELDLSKKIKDQGYKTLFVSEARAYHKGGGTSDQVKAKRLFYNTRSRIIYGLKHFGPLQGIFLLLFTFLIEPISRIFLLVMNGKYSDIIENLKGFWMLYKDSYRIIKLGLKK